MKGTRGFTLAEIIIVVAVLGIIASIVLFNIATAARKSRDGDRQADLRTLQSAVELYKQKNGRYPAGCRGPGVWSGQIGTSYACTGGNSQYIVGHAAGFNFAPTFIPTLPTDKRLNGLTSGYVYTTNTAGTVYKIMAKRTVEDDFPNYSHPFKPCDATHSATGICDATAPTGNKPTYCQETNANFTNTYAVWGGFANGGDALAVEQLTEDILCDIP